MFYKYFYYKIYCWVKKKYGDDYPQFYVLNVITIFPFLNIITLLKIISYFNIIGLDIRDYSEHTFLFVLTILIPVYIFNVIYFFWINHWENIINYFNDTKVRKIDILIFYTYLFGTITAFIIVVISIK